MIGIPLKAPQTRGTVAYDTLPSVHKHSVTRSDEEKGHSACRRRASILSAP